ncbi:hypothetical protein GH714_025376 [Hevea brasiliensis]|uniref:MLO-like protein n=1 Tax=Hevea brasiliensis TaxID=3981 RepID=A0A6A6MKN9_HEVBR|nr:hypothetical protein GH714_025376 [Hevea brasiliensis]
MSRIGNMVENTKEVRSLALTPTWSVATVLTIFVVVSLIVERSIHRLSNWLRKTNRKPLLAAVEKMKEELMLLGFISLLLTATSSTIANICIPSKFYSSNFAPCSRTEIDEEPEENTYQGRKLLLLSAFPLSVRRMLNRLDQNTCKEGHEPFVSYEGLEQLHRFIFVMAVTHISYSCLTMLLAIVKTCFFRQFGHSVVRTDYLTLRKGFIMNHNLSMKYDFHSYMIRSMEEEFQRIVGVSGPLWGFVVAFMLFNVKGSNLYFWIAIIPITLVLLVGTKLQHVIATLSLESAGITGYFAGTKLKPRDDLFWFKKPELLLTLIHFILFQAFRIEDGNNYKAALIPQGIRETIHGWGKAARRKRRHGIFTDDSTIHTDTSTVLSLEEDDHLYLNVRDTAASTHTEVELQPVSTISNSPVPVASETSSRVGTPLLRPSASISSPKTTNLFVDSVPRSSSMPARRE